MATATEMTLALGRTVYGGDQSSEADSDEKIEGREMRLSVTWRLTEQEQDLTLMASVLAEEVELALKQVEKKQADQRVRKGPTLDRAATLRPFRPQAASQIPLRRLRAFRLDGRRSLQREAPMSATGTAIRLNAVFSRQVHTRQQVHTRLPVRLASIRTGETVRQAIRLTFRRSPRPSSSPSSPIAPATASRTGSCDGCSGRCSARRSRAS